MSLSDPFIRRPVGTTLLTLAVAMAGGLAYFFLPVSPLPQVDFPTISVSAGLPGASPETMASAVATPLERQFGHIAGVTEMTSTSYLGSTGITLQFDLSRNIDAAARDVQAAINAAAGDLPTNLPSRPGYRKVNPADAPILILAITSNLYSRGQMYDLASSILSQKLAQVDGVGQVFAGGGALPAVRVEVNPMVLNNMGLGLADIPPVLAAANANRPKGEVSDGRRSWLVTATDQLYKAKEYQPLIVAYRNGAPIRLADVASVIDSVEDTRTNGIFNGKSAIPIMIFRQPNANIIDTVNRVLAMMPELQAEVPPDMKLSVAVDRSVTIRRSVRDVELTLLCSICLVIFVVFVFLRDGRSTLIPSVAVPVSLVGTFGVMYVLGYSLDNLSLMALTIATGFVVDDAIVVIENSTRYLEQGMPPLQAALRGAGEVGFTVLSMSLSLVAVFIPILMMSGYVGRMFREFAVTLSVAVGISLLVSLTTTPMMCATLLRSRTGKKHNWLYRANEWTFNAVLGLYRRSLQHVLHHPVITVLVLIATIALNVYQFGTTAWELFPQQDTGRMIGTILADQDTSSQAMRRLIGEFAATTSGDPAVQDVIGFSGGSGGTANRASMFVSLKPLAERKLSVDQVMGRLRGKLARIPGGTLYFKAIQDVNVGARGSNALYQYTLQADNLADLAQWAPKVAERLHTIKGLADVNSDQQDRGLLAGLTYDRATASRLGLTPQAIDSTLYAAFGQEQVSTMYAQLNQYHVVMEVDPNFATNPTALRYIYANAPGQTPVPLSAFTSYAQSNTPLSVNHQSQFPCITISFNLRPGVALGDAVAEIEQATRDMGLPATLHGKFAGTAQAYQDMLANMWLLGAAALAAVYIILGVLYESYVHPITIILASIPSAGVGALLALKICGTALSVIAFIGIILLVGIVKKNGIMMIDFAIDVQRKEGLSPRDAIFQACQLRFRPIMMTTMAALLGGLPLAIGLGEGAELRRPLGIAIVGGLMLSQVLTLYTTPVVYYLMDRLRLWCVRLFGGHSTPPPLPATV